MASFGMVGLDWQERINWDRMRKYRLERAREKMKAHGLGAMLLMYDENVTNIICTSLPRRPIIAGPAPPLYGTCTAWVPVAIRNISISSRFALLAAGEP